MPEIFGRAAAAFAILAFAVSAPAQADPEKIKIGVILNSAQAPIYLALEHGYFVAEGLDATLVPFDAAVPVAVAAASGDVDFGSVGATGGFYNLAGQGVLRIIGGNSHEVPGFQMFGFVAASSAYEKGLTSPKDLPGHSVAVTQIGGGYHYSLALLAPAHAAYRLAIGLIEEWDRLCMLNFHIFNDETMVRIIAVNREFCLPPVLTPIAP